MDVLLNGWTNVHPSNTDYIFKKFDQFQICNGWVNYWSTHQIPSMSTFVFPKKQAENLKSCKMRVKAEGGGKLRG